MSETRSLRITDQDLDQWVDDNVDKGDLNPLMNQLLLEYRKKKDQEYVEIKQDEETDRKITIFNGVVLISIALWMFIFALSKYYDVLSMISTFLLILSGVLLCLYVFITRIRRTEKGVIA